MYQPTELKFNLIVFLWTPNYNIERRRIDKQLQKMPNKVWEINREYNYMIPLTKIILNQTARHSMTSGYYGGKISGTQQSFLTETAICVVERW